MKLYIEEKLGPQKTGQNIYIDKVATTRRGLQNLIGSKDFYVNNERYYVSQVKAMKSSDGTAIGMAVGGVLGLIGGAAGVAAGGVIGGILGKDNDIKEEEKIKKFNGSRL